MDRYVCLNCEKTFDEPETYTEMHGFTEGPGEKIAICPWCGHDEIIEAIYCDICGDPILDDYIKTAQGDLICADCYIIYNAQEQ